MYAKLWEIVEHSQKFVEYAQGVLVLDFFFVGGHVCSPKWSICQVRNGLSSAASL